MPIIILNGFTTASRAAR
ncbi:MAG: hypothetical protein J5709_01425 [Bacteroidales bacterium]|nr:hypothetical protein [Bacteroidales bacterium]